MGLSYIGFWINPAATPARVALGIIAILAVLTNYGVRVRVVRARAIGARVRARVRARARVEGEGEGD